MSHLVVGNIHGQAVNVIIGEVGSLAANRSRAVASNGRWQRGAVDSTVVELTLQALQQKTQWSASLIPVFNASTIRQHCAENVIHQ